MIEAESVKRKVFMRFMKKILLSLFGILLIFTCAACVNESPEPWIELETTEERTLVKSEVINGIAFNFFSDKTCEIMEYDVDKLIDGSFLQLPDNCEEYTVVAIADGCFRNSTLLGVILPAKLERLGDYAFQRSTVQEIVLPDTLTYLGKEAFDNCDNLEKLTLGSGLERIPVGAFYSCRAMKELVIPEGVRIIEEEAFADLASLEKLSFPESLEEIGPYAFWNTGIDSLTFSIPEGVQKIGVNAFRSTAWLRSQSAEWVIVGKGVLLQYNGTAQSVTLPDTVRYLSNAFDSKKVKNLTLPDTLGDAAEDALAESGLEKVIYNGTNPTLKALIK